ncbi:MAG: hypothetical protein N3B16_10490 [Candidatus Aminicenantes bacterium]|nr:hypothetical protein [Candidatus Aminicenantes bacterium]
MAKGAQWDKARLAEKLASLVIEGDDWREQIVRLGEDIMKTGLMIRLILKAKSLLWC